MARVLIGAGLPQPALEFDLIDEFGRFVARLDLAYPAARLAVELQSVAHHLNRRSFESDPLRRNKIARQGWTLLEFTWAYTHNNTAEAVAEIAYHLRHAA